MIAAPPPVALAVSPARVVVAAGASAELQVTNRGATAASVDVSPAGFALSLRGRARILAHAAPVIVARRRLVVPAHATATVVVSAPRAGWAGDRPALVLLATRAPRSGIGVRLRLGVVVLVRGPGQVVHRVVPQVLRRRRNRLELWLRNAGNVAERLDAKTVRVSLVRGGRVVARARPVSRELLPHARGVLVLRYAGRVQSRGRAIVEVRIGARILRRTLTIS